MREHTIVTISRQYGSGGREVAEILAKKMQVRCYDRQIVYLAAEKIGNGDLDVESILEEAYKVPGSHSGLFGGLGIGSDVIPDYNKMYKEQAALIHRLADKIRRSIPGTLCRCSTCRYTGLLSYLHLCRRCI